MTKTAVIGDKNSIYGFAAVGMEIYAADNEAQAREHLKRLSQGGYAAIYITEELASCLTAEMAALSSRLVPAVIPIPGLRNNTGIGMKNVSRTVEQAVGSDIIS